MSADRLKIRCPTWDHLENFYDSKIKKDNVLLARVPFSPAVGSKLVIALELPDEVVIELEAEVMGVRQAPDGRRSAIRMHVLGLTESVRERLVRAVVTGRGGAKRYPPFSSAPAVSIPRTQTGVPVPIPSDVPIDEEVPCIALPDVKDVDSQFREQYKTLFALLQGLREKAAHEVLGISWDAEVTEIRAAYFVMVKKVHPDVLARHDSEDISLLASEIFIYVNQAYDRLRDSAVAAGKAIAAGPALLPHTGWIANFDEIGVVKTRQPLRNDDLSVPVTMPLPRALPAPMEPVTADEKPASRQVLKAPATRDSIVVQFSTGSAKSTAAENITGSSIPVDVNPSSLETEDLFADARATGAGMKPLSNSAAEPESNNKPEGDVSAILLEGKQLLADGCYSESRDCFAKILEISPRDRETRALYHVAFAHTLLGKDKDAEALTQFEVALQHDPNCESAKEAKLKLRSSGKRKPGLFKKWFR